MIKELRVPWFFLLVILHSCDSSGQKDNVTLDAKSSSVFYKSIDHINLASLEYEGYEIEGRKSLRVGVTENVKIKIKSIPIGNIDVAMPASSVKRPNEKSEYFKITYYGEPSGQDSAYAIIRIIVQDTIFERFKTIKIPVDYNFQ